MSMHELNGRIANVSFSYEGRPMVTLELFERRNAPAIMTKFLELKNEEILSLKIDKPKKKRSLDANAYAWVLIGKIAEKTNVPKEEVYRDNIRSMGGNYEIVCVQDKAVDSLCQMWERNGIGWLTDTMPSKIDGCTNVFLFYGSSEYTVDQMRRLTEFLKQDCDALGIDTKSQAEIDSLLSSWGGR